MDVCSLVYETLIQDSFVLDNAAGRIKYYKYPETGEVDEKVFIIIDPLDVPVPSDFGDNRWIAHDTLLQIEVWSKDRKLVKEVAERIQKMMWNFAAGFSQTGGRDEYDVGIFRDSRRYRGKIMDVDFFGLPISVDIPTVIIEISGATKSDSLVAAFLSTDELVLIDLQGQTISFSQETGFLDAIMVNLAALSKNNSYITGDIETRSGLFLKGSTISESYESGELQTARSLEALLSSDSTSRLSLSFIHSLNYQDRAISFTGAMFDRMRSLIGNEQSISISENEMIRLRSIGPSEIRAVSNTLSNLDVILRPIENILSNGLDTIDTWTNANFMSTQYITVSTEQSMSGQSIKWGSQPTGKNISFAPTATTYDVPVIAGERYILSMYTKSDQAFAFNLGVKGSNGVVIAGPTKTQTVTPGWVRQYFDFTAATNALQVQFTVHYANVLLYLDNFMLEKAAPGQTIPNEWEPYAE